MRSKAILFFASVAATAFAEHTPTPLSGRVTLSPSSTPAENNQTVENQKGFERLEDQFNSRFAKPAPEKLFSAENTLRGEACFDKFADGRYEATRPILVFGFDKVGFSKDKAGLALLVNVPQDKVDLAEYQQTLRKETLKKEATHVGNTNHIAVLAENQKKKGSLFFRRDLLLITSKSGPFHWIEYEVREVPRAGQVEYVIKSTEYYVPILEYNNPPQVLRTTYCF